MKIREVRFQHIRGFGAPLRRVMFYDQETNLVRPLSVLVGSNGSGKSTVFQLIEGLLGYALNLGEARPITQDLRENGYAALELEFDQSAPEELSKDIWIALGRKDRAPDGYEDLPNQICRLEQRGAPGKPFRRSGDRQVLQQWVGRMMREETELRDGMLLFPHNRWIEHEQLGSIEAPPQDKSWLFRFEPDSAWKGSLSQLWVWQNYLDLEAGREGRANLLPFVEPIESLLGRSRRIVIRKGHVKVIDPSGRAVEIHQLPSGEQSLLTLFGEIVRRLRRGAVLLIDEIENSLHPALQRAVIAHLRQFARAYDLQVIVSTHSMEIVKTVALHEVVNLDDMAPTELQQGA